MVAQAGGYLSTPFKGCRGVTQGDPLYIKILNAVIYAVLQNWVTVVALKEEELDPVEDDTEGLGKDIHHIAALLYADDGILALTWVAQIQRALNTLT